MSLRLRTVLITALALVLLWAGVAAWMMQGVRTQLDETLDQRLATSAHMISSLLERSAIPADAPGLHWADAIRVGGADGMACEIRVADGTLLAQSGDLPYSTAETLKTGYSTRNIDGHDWRLYVLDDQQGYQIMTADRLENRHGLTTAMLSAAGIPFLIAALGGLLAVWIGIGRGLSPLDRLRHTLLTRQPDDTTPIDRRHTPQELQPVITALNDLLKRLAQSLADQRAFTDAAAHELRSPLTAISTHLQVAQITQGEPARASLEQAGQGVARLHHILEQMMSLARAEAPATTNDACHSIHQVIGLAIEQINPIQRARVHVEHRAPDSACAIPQSMLTTALRNLIDNALRYSASDQIVHLTSDLIPGQCQIQVADRGPGLDSAQIQHIGQRFWRGDQGRQQGEGSGLGISIVRAIVQRFGGHLTLEPRPGGGLVATVQAPIRPPR